MARRLDVTDQEIRSITRLGRTEFLEDYWDYRIGEHVTVIADTQKGKTTLLCQLLQIETSPETPGLVLVMKPGDPVVSEWVKPLGYKRITTWPPPVTKGRHQQFRKVNGWFLWPKLGDIDEDDDILYREFSRALRDLYRRGARKGGARTIIVCDEIMGLVDLGLQSRLDRIYQQGSGMKLPLWGGSQRPFGAPVHMYSAARHLFLATDEDDRNRKRYSDIGGVNSDLIRYVTHPHNDLMGEYEFFYINKNQRTYAIIGAT